jgi:hypothetical protein
VPIEFVHGGHDAILEFLFGFDTDVAQHCSIRARSTRLAGSVRERAIAPNFAKSFSPIANSIACRHAVMSSTSLRIKSRKARTHVGKCESSPYDGFHGIDVVVAVPTILSPQAEAVGGE